MDEIVRSGQNEEGFFQTRIRGNVPILPVEGDLTGQVGVDYLRIDLFALEYLCQVSETELVLLYESSILWWPGFRRIMSSKLMAVGVPGLQHRLEKRLVGHPAAPDDAPLVDTSADVPCRHPGLNGIPQPSSQRREAILNAPSSANRSPAGSKSGYLPPPAGQLSQPQSPEGV